MSASFFIDQNYLPENVNEKLLAHTINSREYFKETHIVNDIKETGDQALHNWRKSQRLSASKFEEFYLVLEQKVRNDFTSICNNLGKEIFEIDRLEIQLTSHNDGDFYKPHKDNNFEKGKSRLITFVYYFHSLPRQFSGGQLLFFEPPAVVEPENNSIVFFDSSLKHAVHPISCPSKKFEDGRFTLNGWIRKKEH